MPLAPTLTLLQFSNFSSCAIMSLHLLYLFYCLYYYKLEGRKFIMLLLVSLSPNPSPMSLVSLSLLFILFYYGSLLLPATYNLGSNRKRQDRQTDRQAKTWRLWLGLGYCAGLHSCLRANMTAARAAISSILWYGGIQTPRTAIAAHRARTDCLSANSNSNSSKRGACLYAAGGSRTAHALPCTYHHAAFAFCVPLPAMPAGAAARAATAHFSPACTC